MTSSNVGLKLPIPSCAGNVSVLTSTKRQPLELMLPWLVASAARKTLLDLLYEWSVFATSLYGFSGFPSGADRIATQEQPTQIMSAKPNWGDQHPQRHNSTGPARLTASFLTPSLILSSSCCTMLL